MPIILDGTTGITTPGLSNTGSETLSSGTANGVTYLNGSKVLTSGSALTFDGTTLGNTKNDVTGTTELLNITRNNSGTFIKLVRNAGSGNAGGLIGADSVGTYYAGSTTANMMYVDTANTNLQFYANSTEGMRLTPTGLGIGTSSPATKLDVTGLLRSNATTNGGGQLTIAKNGTTVGGLCGSGNWLGTPATDLALFAETGGSIKLFANGLATNSGTFNQYGFGIGAAVPSSGQGITFPAAQDASSNANTLDDYEEGTFTCTGASFINVSSFSVSSATYTKIGRLVYVEMNGLMQATNSNVVTSGTLSLPFAATSSSVRGGTFARQNYEGALGSIQQGTTTTCYFLFTAANAVQAGSNANWTSSFFYSV